LDEALTLGGIAVLVIVTWGLSEMAHRVELAFEIAAKSREPSRVDRLARVVAQLAWLALGFAVRAVGVIAIGGLWFASGLAWRSICQGDVPLTVEN